MTMTPLIILAALSGLMPPAKPLAIITRPPRPYHLCLSLGQGPAMFYVATNGQGYTREMFSTNGNAVLSNLWQNTTYAIAASAVDTNGIESDLSPVLVWPWPQTNVMAMLWSTNYNGPWQTNQSLTFTLPPPPFYARGVVTDNISVYEKPD